MAEATDKVKTAFEEVRDLVLSYGKTHTRPNINFVSRMLSGLCKKDFLALYELLNEFAKTDLAQVRFDPVAEITSAAEADRQFGHLTNGMADWYDNEVAAASRSTTQQQRVVDALIELVREIEKHAP